MKPLIGAGGSASRAAEEEALIARLSTLAPALDGEPDADWEARTRTRLVAMAAVRPTEPEPVSPLRRMLARREGPRSAWRTRLTAGLAGAAAAVTVVAGVVPLAADAQPGDALYGLKRGTEQTQLALAGDARGRTLLGFASTRLEELSVALDDGDPAELIAETLATMDAQTSDGAAWLAERAVADGTSAPLDEIAGWSAGQSAGLADLRGAVPADARAEAADSAALLTAISERADALRVALDCPAGPATAGADELGPVPAACTAAPGPSVGGEQPGPPVTDEPGTPAAPTPGSPSGGSDGSGSGSGGSGSGSSASDSEGSGSDDPDTGGGDPRLPGVDPDTGLPTVPDLPVDPDLPTLLPSPDDVLRPPAGGSAGSTSGKASGGTSGNDSGGSEDTGVLPDVELCLPPLINC